MQQNQNKMSQTVQLSEPWTENYGTREAYKALRTNLMFCGRDKKVIALTSCQENEGKSTLTMGLAKSLAEVGKRVLLIDADMRKSNMQNVFTEGGEYLGLSQYLSGQAEWREALCVTQYPNLHVMFCGYYPPNPVELLENSRFRNMVSDARAEYDYVLIDTPPIGAVIDAAVIARACDGTIMVIAINKVSAKLARACKAQLGKSGCPLLGAILNQTEKHSRAYYRGKKSYYQNVSYYSEN